MWLATELSHFTWCCIHNLASREIGVSLLANGWPNSLCVVFVVDQPLQSQQCWGSYFLQVTRYILLFTLKKFQVLQLHITSKQK